MVEKHLQKLMELARLPDDWDGYGASKAHWISVCNAAHALILGVPYLDEVSLASDGSIYFILNQFPDFESDITFDRNGKVYYTNFKYQPPKVIHGTETIITHLRLLEDLNGRL